MLVSRRPLFASPSERTERRRTALLFGLLWFKFLWFDVSWCAASTYRPFSMVETYLSATLAALILLLPLVIWRMQRTTWVVAILTDVLLICNLMYFRTYYTAIPPDSYLLVGNLRDFTDSVWGSLKITDALFPASTVVAATLRYRRRGQASRLRRSVLLRRYTIATTVTAAALLTLTLVKGGFRAAYESMQGSYTHTCVTPMYTVFGTFYYDCIRGAETFTPEVGQQIEAWMTADHTARMAADADTLLPDTAVRQHVIIILAESLESWVLERAVEGQELTPRLNALLRDSLTIYAPHILSQAKGGRSIDAQLMINAGLLPIASGAYSLKYPHTTYPSLAEAMRAEYGADAVRAYALTGDKPMVWNQAVIDPALGYDSLIAKASFVNDEPVGPSYRPQIGDVSLLRQIAEKIVRGEVWDARRHMLLQCVTYSGHFPFALPERLREVRFSDRYPERMRDYMATARYTDRAIGLFVDRLRAAGVYDNTLVVITGDHEGLGEMRRAWCESAGGRGLVADRPMVPFIVLNAPRGMRVEAVGGQVDIYPTLLRLLGLRRYAWRGMGRSLTDPTRPPVAVDPYGTIYGRPDSVAAPTLQRLKEAWPVSDAIIRYDYSKRSSKKK